MYYSLVFKEQSAPCRINRSTVHPIKVNFTGLVYKKGLAALVLGSINAVVLQLSWVFCIYYLFITGAYFMSIQYFLI